MVLRRLVQRYAEIIYFALAFVIAWGGIPLAIGPGGLSPSVSREMSLGLLVFLAMLLGPSVAGLLLTLTIDGKGGIQALWERWRHWRFPFGWVAIALLLAPLLLLIVGALLSTLSSAFIPRLIADSDRTTILIFGLTVGLLAGFFEEIGWTGFVLPRLITRNGMLKAGLILGGVWGIWHLLADYWGNAGAFGTLYP
ncbi:MAG: CPBP family intramembrane metalloprotease, partial [Caldilineaceae bacterium]|nr:CPBP family intramembrane metalloprotease [Caldilineaceae bacterium]